MQVLREVYAYSGDVRGVPQDLVDFMSERAAGNPKYIIETLAALVKARHVDRRRHAAQGDPASAPNPSP